MCYSNMVFDLYIIIDFSVTFLVLLLLSLLYNFIAVLRADIIWFLLLEKKGQGVLYGPKCGLFSLNFLCEFEKIVYAAVVGYSIDINYVDWEWFLFQLCLTDYLTTGSIHLMEGCWSLHCDGGFIYFSLWFYQFLSHFVALLLGI